MTLPGKVRVQEPGTDGTFSDILSAVAGLARIVIVNLPRHVTQRGNARQFLLASDAGRIVYLDLLPQRNGKRPVCPRLSGYQLKQIKSSEDLKPED